MIPRQPRGVTWFAASIILHVVIGVVLIRTLALPSVLRELFSNRGRPTMVERIGFLALPRSGGPTATPKEGGDNRPLVAKPIPQPPAQALTAPATEPAAVPPAPKAAGVRPPDAGGYGEVVGGGGATRGMRPSYSDPRLWLPSSPVVTAPVRPQTRAESLQTLLADKIRMFNDSAAAVPAGRAPGDWTFTDKSGRKWGVDQQYIRLGKFSIPTAVLGMLPLNVQANPVQIERQRTMSEMTREISEQAARYDRDQSFRAAVRALRERKDRERKEAQAKADAASGSPAQPPTKP